VAAQLLITGLHELSESGFLPSSKKEMALIGPIVRNDFFFFVTILALAGLMVLFEARRRQPGAVPESAAEKRKAAWSARRERLWMVSVYATSFLFILLITAEFIYAKGESTLSAATPVSFVNGVVSIPMTQAADGDLHRYAVSEGGTQIRFLLYQKPDGKVAVVFDACEICGSVGFFKTQNGLVCKNCASPINSQSVGTPGGCNPVPLKASISGGDIVIQEADLGAGARLFKR
jgi:high-affinity iron transporter